MYLTHFGHPIPSNCAPERPPSSGVPRKPVGHNITHYGKPAGPLIGNQRPHILTASHTAHLSITEGSATRSADRIQRARAHDALISPAAAACATYSYQRIVTTTRRTQCHNGYRTCMSSPHPTVAPCSSRILIASTLPTAAAHETAVCSVPTTACPASCVSLCGD